MLRLPLHGNVDRKCNIFCSPAKQKAKRGRVPHFSPPPPPKHRKRDESSDTKILLSSFNQLSALFQRFSGPHPLMGNICYTGNVSRGYPTLAVTFDFVSCSISSIHFDPSQNIYFSLTSSIVCVSHFCLPLSQTLRLSVSSRFATRRRCSSAILCASDPAPQRLALKRQTPPISKCNFCIPFCFQNAGLFSERNV